MIIIPPAALNESKVIPNISKRNLPMNINVRAIEKAIITALSAIDLTFKPFFKAKNSNGNEARGFNKKKSWIEVSNIPIWLIIMKLALNKFSNIKKLN